MSGIVYDDSFPRPSARWGEVRLLLEMSPPPSHHQTGRQYLTVLWSEEYKYQTEELMLAQFPPASHHVNHHTTAPPLLPLRPPGSPPPPTPGRPPAGGFPGGRLRPHPG